LIRSLKIRLFRRYLKCRVFRRSLTPEPVLVSFPYRKLWSEVPKKINSHLDDLVYGGYYRETRVPLTHHSGFSQTKADFDHQIYIEMTKATTWKFPFRPIAFHQLMETAYKMPEIHRLLSAVNYTNVDPNPYPEPSECKCLDAGNHRCTPEYKHIDDAMCNFGARATYCLYDTKTWESRTL
jgi:hypothetical protein